MPVFITDANSSWQKVAIENTIKLIRQYIPKGMDIGSVTGTKIASIQAKINRRPRKNKLFNTKRRVLQGLSLILHLMVDSISDGYLAELLKEEWEKKVE